MFLINHPLGLWVNGTIGKIVEIADSEIIIELEDGKIVAVERYKWTLFKYKFEKEKNRLIQESLGSFIQFPLRLSWAITIHKSQGKSFDKAIIDVGRAFAHGQTYVALSRCRSFEGLKLKKPLKKGHVIMDYKVIKFLTQFQYEISEKKCSKEDKVAIIQKAIEDRKKINIIYLKANDQKSSRTIMPTYVGTLIYKNRKYLGVEAYCMKRKEDRVFRVDRILELST